IATDDGESRARGDPCQSVAATNRQRSLTTFSRTGRTTPGSGGSLPGPDAGHPLHGAEGRATYVPHGTATSGQPRSLPYVLPLMSRTRVIAGHGPERATDLPSWWCRPSSLLDCLGRARHVKAMWPSL